MKNRNFPSEQVSTEKLKAMEAQQKASMKNLGLDEIIYYKAVERIVDKRTKNMVDFGEIGVIVLFDKKSTLPVARGITVRSPKDTRFPLKARVLARGRALRAIKTGTDSSPVNLREDIADNEAISIVSGTYGCKSMRDPVLNDYELTLLQRAVEYNSKGDSGCSCGYEDSK